MSTSVLTKRVILPLLLVSVITNYVYIFIYPISLTKHLSYLKQKLQCNNNEFTCDNGDCIPIVNRCDIIKDCLDKSDEINCTTLTIDDYLKTDPPIEQRNSSGIQMKTKVVIFSVSHFDEMLMTFDARFGVLSLPTLL